MKAPNNMNASATCLQVTRSLSGRHWRLVTPPLAQAMACSEQNGLPPLLGEILAARGVSAADAPAYLAPKLQDLLPDPHALQDMEKAAERLAQALLQKEAIAVFGDYDVDGASASALLMDYLAACGAAPRLYIPDRNREGYGPNAAAMRQLADEGARLVVTVDCGMMAHEALAAGQAQGLEVIVTDHHRAGASLPPAHAVVNPQRADDTSGLTYLAGVGVAFMLLVATHRLLRARKFWAQKPAPNLLRFLDLVALGTVCDLVPLVGLNRAFVVQGLKVMAQGARPGLVHLAQLAKLRGPLDAQALGFRLGPRVNAGGRLSRAALGVEMLRTESCARGQELAEVLHGLNAERQAIEQKTLAAAEAQLAADKTADKKAPDFICVAGEGWHKGVLGLVAARLKERSQRPSFVVGFAEGSEEGSGSARSVPGVNVGALMTKAQEKGAVQGGGGHAAAAGFRVGRAQMPALRAFLQEEFQRLPLEEIFARAQEMRIDAIADVQACTRDLCEQLEAAGPYGSGNPEPRLALAGARIAWAEAHADGHVRCRLQSAQGGSPLAAIAFQRCDAQMRAQLLASARALPPQSWHLAGHLRRDDYRAQKRVSFVIEDAAPA